MPSTQERNHHGKSQRKIANFLIDPSYQLKYIYWLLGSSLTILILTSATFYSYISENYAILVDLSPMTNEAKIQLYHELDTVVFQLCVGSFFFLILICLLGIVITHRTAGPMFRFKAVFEQIKSGNLEARIHLRPKDDFQDVANGFNSMMDSISKKPPTP